MLNDWTIIIFKEDTKRKKPLAKSLAADFKKIH